MKTITKSFASVAASASGLAAAVTADVWPLTATSAGDGLAHKLTITGLDVTNHSAKTALITGFDENFAAQTETLALPNGTATVTSTKYWSKVSAVVPSATIGADEMNIGWAAASLTPWFNVMYSNGQFGLGLAVTVDSGTPNYTLQHSYDSVKAFDHATVAAKTVAAEASYTAPVAALRLSFSAAGGVTLTCVGNHF